MKILYIHQYFVTPEDTCGTRSYEIARYLVSRGCEVHMLTGTSIESEVVEGIKIYTTNTSYKHSYSYIRRIISFFIFILKATGAGLKIKNIDIIYATSTPLTVGIIGVILKLFKRAALVFEVRDVWPDVPVEMGIFKNKVVVKLLKWMEIIIYKKSDHIIALSPDMKKNLLEKNVPGIKLTVAENMANNYLVEELDKSPDIGVKGAAGSLVNMAEGKFICIHPGAFGRVNGLEFIIEISILLRKQEDIWFFLVGEGREKEKIQELIQMHKLQNVVIRPGIPKKELFRLLLKSHLGIMTVDHRIKILEGNSANKFFDYLSCGLPVLINYGGWQEEVLENNKAGFSCKTPREMAEKIIFLYQNPEVREGLCSGAKILSLRQYDREIICKRIFEVLQEVYISRSN